MGLIDSKDALQIIAFRTYGNARHLYARGRALEDEIIDLLDKGFFKLLLNSWKRFETDEIRNTPVSITLSDGQKADGKTDNDGYYLIDVPLSELDVLTDTQGWLQYEIAYTDRAILWDKTVHNRFLGEMLIPSKLAEYGVISDIDDTILHTGVVSSLKWRVIINTFFKRADKRIPLEGAAQFYRMLQLGKSEQKANPIFYVSHSPWNLYRYLEFFLIKNNFPKGPILLRSWREFGFGRSKSDMPQKQKEILNILKTYPELSFILIGDSGENDAAIYLEVVTAFPNRVKAIYLRSVAHKRKMIKVKQMLGKFGEIPVMLVEKSDDAVFHARWHGFIK
ncbi:MAG: DUF2183 domain-containing protein [Flavobacteriales bacterium]|nr:MAG: DUF2183 domain-containing protein [Flavobacteriales bacterium]